MTTLVEIDSEKVMAALNSKNSSICSCGHRNLTVLPYLLKIPVASKGIVPVPDPVIQVIGVSCKKCGNLRLHREEILLA